MKPLALDTWAFVELALDRPRAVDVAARIEAAPSVLTSREVVAESYGFLLKRTGTLRAQEWLSALLADEVPLKEPAIDEIRRVLSRLPKTSGLSFVDVSLAVAALASGASEVATADREFVRLRLDPVFA